MYTRDTEIRHISSADVFKLGQILEQTNSWKKLMRIIPSKIDDNILDIEKKYNNDHIHLVENASIKRNRMATEILFDEWGTSGRKRPTVGNLLQLLIEAELFRAADFVAQNFLNEPLPERPLKGPAAKIDISIPFLSEDIREVEKILDETHYPGTRTLIDNIQTSTTVEINKDFYEKVTFDGKNIPDNDDKAMLNYNNYSQNEQKTVNLIQFSSENIENDSIITDSNNIPFLSKLVDNKESLNSLSTMTAAHQQIKENRLNKNKMYNVDDGGNDYIPNLSIFENENYPNLSILNGNESNVQMQNGDENSTASSSSSSTSDISSSNSDDVNQSIPNLSILGQCVENGLNDSSLTSVTETSDESNFSSDGGKLEILMTDIK